MKLGPSHDSILHGQGETRGIAVEAERKTVRESTVDDQADDNFSSLSINKSTLRYRFLWPPGRNGYLIVARMNCPSSKNGRAKSIGINILVNRQIASGSSIKLGVVFII